jgi:hypothetical protein
MIVLLAFSIFVIKATFVAQRSFSLFIPLGDFSPWLVPCIGVYSHGVDLNVDLIINIIISIRGVFPFNGNVFLVCVPRIIQLFSLLK